jgi:hypothetical protein
MGNCVFDESDWFEGRQAKNEDLETEIDTS